jgi:hypothetical protein
MSLGAPVGDAAGDVLDPLGAADGGAAIFLDDESHGFGAKKECSRKGPNFN